MLDVAVVIVSWNVRDYLTNCLCSVYAEIGRSGLRGEVWVIDNASTDGSVDLVADLYPRVHLLANDRNLGFGAANNKGMQATAAHSPSYLFLLNPDTLLRRGALTQLVACLEEQPNAGMAGARLVYGDGRFQHSAFAFPGLVQLAFDLFPMPARLYESRLNGRYPRRRYRPDGQPFAIDHPLGASMMVRQDVAEATNGFDESFRLYCEEIDWCWRIRRSGWEIYAVPAAEIVHFGGGSTRQVPAQSIVDLWRSRARLYRKHHGRFRFALAAWMVKVGMAKKAAVTTDPALKRAYRQVIDIWTADGEGPGQAAMGQATGSE
jgi:GT2 family glycosyltransferase